MISGLPQGAVYTRDEQDVLPLSVTVDPVGDGGTLSYQWYSSATDSSSGGTAISPNGTGASYTPPTTTGGILYYYVKVTNTITDNGDGGTKNASVISNTARIEVNNKVNAQFPVISAQPVGTFYPRNTASPAALSVTASSPDGGSLSYQWYSNAANSNSGGTAISPNGTNVTYTPPTTTEGILYYYVEVTNTISNNGDGGIKSQSTYSNTAAITITVTNAQTPVISAQPVGTSYPRNTASPAALSVTASSPDGGSLSYQWYSNAANSNSGGTAISPNGTNATYTPPTTTEGILYYYVEVTNTISNNGDGGTKSASVTSVTAAITVTGGYTSVADITNYLSTASGGTTAAAPVPLPVAMYLSYDNWSAILSAIASGNKYVALDLSACTMANLVFDPDKTISTGKDKIVSLVPPNAASRLGSFRYFTALESFSGPGIIYLYSEAFYYCTALTTVDFPAAISIGASAFEHCTALTTVDLPAATSIGPSAFCMTGETALTVTLPRNAPTLPGGSTTVSAFTKAVTVKTPADRSGYDSASWQENFKKTFGAGASINLSFVP